MTDDQGLSGLPDDIVLWPYGGPMFADKEGNPISLRRYAELSQTPDYKRVAETVIGDWWVSTVWLGNNHNFGNGPPIIFESMPFYKGKAPLKTLHPELQYLDQSECRYYTEAEAIAGHDNMCIEIRRLLANVEMADEVMREAVEGTWPPPVEMANEAAQAVNNNPDRETDA